eukprot:CAMPEP_0178449540 /NCGR_PEP_ID=MMETSP0689_2-20121128/42610_1 /TAXON_ID=160604 /ORGANISM="Amphidinium massartii, Strain CS-259" /LENGTH=87 /DNA_ID=CAMNT_0020074875 /DNA_START=27 /DNA_END=287 /DNA_ORIENTATION=+
MRSVQLLLRLMHYPVQVLSAQVSTAFSHVQLLSMDIYVLNVEPIHLLKTQRDVSDVLAVQVVLAVTPRVPIDAALWRLFAPDGSVSI